jgi:hypothetical protein
MPTISHRPRSKYCSQNSLLASTTAKPTTDSASENMR